MQGNADKHTLAQYQPKNTPAFPYAHQKREMEKEKKNTQEWEWKIE
jgi:hypothetical protein